MNYKPVAIIMAIGLLMFSFLPLWSMAHEWMAPKSATEIKNPITPDSDSIEKGKNSYVQSCAVCHGDNIEGLPAQEVGLGMSPPNLKKRIRTHSDGDFFWKIQEGKGEMPSFKDDLAEDEIWEIINYMRASSD